MAITGKNKDVVLELYGKPLVCKALLQPEEKIYMCMCVYMHACVPLALQIQFLRVS